MCEWLSRGEWCDVQLVCKGRTLNAHRVVLASVSEFLRNVLLSCPQEETPVTIVLPDFDLDAMSSVLYYIYNGEILLEKEKLMLFLDIVKLLHIFIDTEYVKALGNSAECSYVDLIKQAKPARSPNIFTLKSENDNELECINIRKREHCQDIQLQSVPSEFDANDNTGSCSRSDISTSLDNSQASYGGRQRNCFLRDLYIETHPQNGNVNGLRGGVQVIPNEHYRLPTSALLTNANGNVASRVDNIVSKTSEEASDYASLMLNLSRKQQEVQECIQLRDQTKCMLIPDNTPWRSFDLSDKRLFINNFSINNKTSTITYNMIKPCQLLPDKNVMPPSTLDFRIEQTMSCSSKCSLNKAISLFNKNVNDCRKYIMEENNNYRDRNIKKPIFNHVIESPWQPRLPNSYKPFRRKDLSSFNATMHCKEEIILENSNDRNNNINNFTSVPDNDVQNDSMSTKEDLVCGVCDQVFTCEDSLNIHMKRHTVIPRYSCGDCGKTFSQLRNFKYHMSVHRGTREFAATCTVCGKYFNDRGYLSSHMKIHRNRKEYKCSMCPKSFNQRVAYNMHMRIHTGVKPHVCSECGKAFSRKMLLKQHQRTHSGERPYACPHCDKRFADRSNMTLHLRLHSGVKPFSCSLCPKSFTKKHHLKSHLNFHTGAKPYSCPRCYLAFTQSSNMRTHLKKCNAPEPSSTAVL